MPGAATLLRPCKLCYNSSMLYRVRGSLLFLLLILLLPVTATAQTDAPASLSAPDTRAFPRVETYLQVHDTQGKFIHGLKAADLRVLEDNLPLSVDEISELRPGAQVVVAINPGPSLASRNSLGKSRYDFLVETLNAWALSRQGSTIDDWSLLTAGGPEAIHIANPLEWLAALGSGQPDARSAKPNLDVLIRAINLAAAPSPRPGMGRAVLFITAPLDEAASLSTESLAAQAVQQGVHVYVWLVAGNSGSTKPKGTDQLMALAAQTRGAFFTYTGSENLPSPEEYLASLRSVYHLTYQSKVTNSGSHQLAVEIQAGEFTLVTPPRTFELEIQPPDPAFIAPVLEIVRRLAPPATAAPVAVAAGAATPVAVAEVAATPGAATSVAATSVASLQPAEQPFQILVTFPDGRTRPLVRTTLFVDGVAVAENTAPPFDQFNWDLGEYTTSGPHLLRVEAEDNLGMVGTSIETQVQITIDIPAQNRWLFLNRNMPVLAGMIALLAGALLLLVLIWGGRLRPYTQRSRAANARRKSDPVTQPVPVRNEPAARRLPSWVNRLQWPQRHVAPKAYAFLARISEGDSLTTNTPIPITSEEVTLGSDPNQAILVLADPSVDALHARLLRTPEGAFRLADEGSVAGTWINYTPVSQGGSLLEHGDLVHIGRVGFRFSLRQPGPVRKPVILLEEVRKEDMA